MTSVRAALLAMWVVIPSVAAAQPASTLSQSGQQAAYVGMGRACVVDAARFCPDISSTQLRNVAICLKPYMYDLSLQCRSALRATAKAPSQ